MPKSPESPKSIARRYFLAGHPIGEIAAQCGVSRRTIERWIKAEDWRSILDAGNVIALIQSEPAEKRLKRQQKIDKLALVEAALLDVSDAMNVAKKTDLRALGSLASSLVKLMEFHQKLQPPTAAEVATLALELGIPPSEFVAELKKQWSHPA